MKTLLDCVVAAGVLMGCLSRPHVALGADWQWLNPLPQGNNLNAVWYNGPNDVFLAGQTGTILHDDGSGFLVMDSGVQTDLEDVWASGPSDAFAVGKAGAILHYDGSAWASMNGGTTEDLWAVSGSGPNDVWAAGENRTVLHYDGENWSVITTGTSAYGLRGAYAASPNDVTFVDAAGTIMHFNGTDWSYSSLPSPYDLRMRDLWGNSPSDIYACGYRTVSMAHMTWIYAVIFHYDGASWTQLPEFEAGWTYVAVWASGPSNVYVAEGATIRRYDGSSWSTVTTGGMNWGIGGSGPADILVAGQLGRIWHFDGSAWSRKSVDLADTGAVYGISGSAPDNVFAAVGIYSPRTGKVLHFDGSAWSISLNVTGYRLYDAWVAGPDAAFVVGESGNALAYDGSTWTATNTGTTEHLYGLSGTGAEDVFAVGDGGTVLHYDGTVWSAMSSPTGADLRDVWAASPNDVFALGRSGTIIHYDGSSWATMVSGTSTDLEGVWGSGSADVYAVGSSGAAFHYDGSTWSSITTGTTKRLTDIWGAAPDDVFTLGDDGTVRHYNGSTWSSMSSPASSDLLAGWGSGPGSVYAVGSNGAILHYSACLLDVSVVNPSFGEVCWSPEPALANPLRYATDTEVQLTATPYAGRSFIQWRLDDANHPGDANYAVTDPNNPLTVVMNADRCATAEFGPLTMVKISQTATPGFASFVAVSGDLAYVAASTSGLLIFDVSDPNQPLLVGQCPTTNARRVAVSGPHAYVADLVGGMKVIDVSDPNVPSCVGQLDTDGEVYTVAVSGDLAYLADGLAGIQVVDISSPNAPARISGYNTPCKAYGVAVTGNHAFVADGEGGLAVIDVSDPNTPTWVNRCLLTGNPMSVTIAGQYAYVACGLGGLQVVDVADPNEPTWVGGCQTGGIVREVPIQGNCALMMDGPPGIELIDLATPDAPVWKGRLDVAYPYGGCIVGRFAYVGGGSGGLVILGLPLQELTLDCVNALWGRVELDPMPSDANLPMYLVDTRVTLTAEPIGSKVFGHWELYDPNYAADANFVVIDSNNPITIVMDADRQVAAAFKCGSGTAPLLPMVLAVLWPFFVVRRRRQRIRSWRSPQSTQARPCGPSRFPSPRLRHV